MVPQVGILCPACVGTPFFEPYVDNSGRWLVCKKNSRPYRNLWNFFIAKMIAKASFAIGLVVPSSYLCNIIAPIPGSLASEARKVFYLRSKWVCDKSAVRAFLIFSNALSNFSVHIHLASFFHKDFKSAVNSCIFDMYTGFDNCKKACHFVKLVGAGMYLISLDRAGCERRPFLSITYPRYFIPDITSWYFISLILNPNSLILLDTFLLSFIVFYMLVFDFTFNQYLIQICFRTIQPREHCIHSLLKNAPSNFYLRKEAGWISIILYEFS